MAKAMFVILVLLMLAVDQASSAASPGCTSGNGCNYPKLAEYNRKMMVAMKRSSAEMMKSEAFNDAELRSVPAGPDPLHHNGGPQKRPRASP